MAKALSSVGNPEVDGHEVFICADEFVDFIGRGVEVLLIPLPQCMTQMIKTTQIE